MDIPLVSINRIFTKLGRDITSDVAEADVIEWSGEALGFMRAPKNMEQWVAFVEVKNHQCPLPKFCQGVIQIAKNNQWDITSSSCTPAVVIPIANTETPTATVPVCLDCNGEPIDDYSVAYYRPFFDLRFETNTWSNSMMYRKHFTPVRLSTNTMINSIACSDKGFNTHAYTASKDEYTIIQGKYARFSFKTGHVAIAYDKHSIDPQTGYPLIPDDESYTTAIVMYITKMIMQRRLYAGREGSANLTDRADKDWQWYCKQARNKGLMLNGIDEHQNLLDQRSFLIPQMNRYYNFFGNLNAPNNSLYGGMPKRSKDGARLSNDGNEVIISSTENITEIINNTINNFDDGELVENQW